MNYIKSYINTSPGQEPARNFAIFFPITISVLTGFYVINNASSSLTDVSSSTSISVLNSPSSNSYLVSPSQENVFHILQSGSYTFKMDYTNSGITYSCIISFVAINSWLYPLTETLYNTLKRSEPLYVYTQGTTYVDEFGNVKYYNDYLDCYGLSSVFSVLYGNLNLLYNNVLPTGGSDNWEYALNNTKGLLSNIATSGSSSINPFYPLVMNMLFSLQVSNTSNKYDIEFFLSKYIYYRTNKTMTCVVYLKEVVNAIPPTWILGTSLLGINTILGGGKPVIYAVTLYLLIKTGTMTEDFLAEITNLVPRIIPPVYDVSIVIDKTLSDVGLSLDLGQTWKFDPRLFDFGLIYVPNNINQAHAYANPTGDSALVSIAMSPSSSSLSVGDHSYAIIGTYYTGATRDLTNQSQTLVSSSNPTVLSIPATGTLSANVAGTANVSFSYGVFSGINNYTVI